MCCDNLKQILQCCTLVVSGNFNGLHAGGPNCLLGASPQVLGVDGQAQPPAPSKPSLKASSSK